ncbi:MAG: hypothetical protein KR126chlam2_01251 [Chlamydiae bacterium]|nr:hypothetical protein [Chlamydiota bacterium]
MSAASSTIPSSTLPKYYKIKDISVSDFTNLKAIVCFDQHNGEESTMFVLVNAKKLIYPISTCDPNDAEPYKYFSLSSGVRQITTRFIDDTTVTIEVQNGESSFTLYVDTQRIIGGKNKSFHEVCNYQPQNLKKKGALAKIADLEKDFPHFHPYFGAYNRHGVALLGWDKSAEQLALCWASPAEDYVHMLEYSKIKRPEDSTGEGEYLAKSKDGFVLFVSWLKITFESDNPVSQSFFINSNLAEKLPLPPQLIAPRYGAK